MKNLFKYLIAIMFVFTLFAMPVMACEDGNCLPTVTSDVQPGVEIHSNVQDPKSSDWAGNWGTADVTLNADAVATGKDSYKTERNWVDGPYYNWRGQLKDGWHLETQEVLVPGESEAYGRNELTLSSDVDIHTNGEQTFGFSYTGVKATTKLDVDGVAWAEGTDGCPQTASIDLEGSLSSFATGRSQSGSFDGVNSLPGAVAYGYGLTTVNFIGNEADSSNHDSLFGLLPNKASVDFDTTITVNQGLFTSSYVSKDGTTTANFAFISGGSAQSALGVDESLFGFNLKMDNIQLTGIHASGTVGQYGLATDGNGAFAYGSSHASFSGAIGSIESIPGRTYDLGCLGSYTEASPGQIANVGGYAVVGGYNNVSVLPNSVTVTSVQYGHSTTGNSGPAQQ